MNAKIRKLVTFVEETHREMDREVTPPVRRAAAVAVIANPFSGRFVEDLSDLIDIGEETRNAEGQARGSVALITSPVRSAAPARSTRPRPAAVRRPRRRAARPRP